MAFRPERRAGSGRDPGMQRVRVGVTGLAAVFLLTLLAASLFALLGRDIHNPARAPEQAVANQNAGEDPPKEPLAELGVAPGNAPKTPAENAAQAAAASPAPSRSAGHGPAPAATTPPGAVAPAPAPQPAR